MEADQVRAQNIDPSGMMIDADVPVTRILTAEESSDLEKQGVDTSSFRDKPVVVSSKEEQAAMKQLIAKAQQASASDTPADMRNATICMDNTLVCIFKATPTTKTYRAPFFFRRVELSPCFAIFIQK